MEDQFRAWWQESYGLPPGPHAVMTHVAWGEHLLRQPLADRARALLAQEAVGPSEKELYDLFCEYEREPVESMRAVLARWGRPTPQPVAVSERLPSAADCDVEDNCWWFDPHADGAWYVDTFQSCYTHWLPAHALPTPEATND